ncbi:calcium/sodium antiporter [Clostridiisalibacter paucivorans]|uniref:calcium/sodium antiporter n=1 Tax=Clostridiisalibacter paucivorans TaxID=408753 RepID=UPI00047B8D36|nr:calcium/sodium antiporter [Clostridiisalibacter paucivorans]
MIITFILFCIGILFIIKGGDLFIESSVEFARTYHLPEIFIGATIISIATTAPEAIVSITAASRGHDSISIGNAIGSIICNTGLILGISNIIVPSKINHRLFKIKSIVFLLFFLIFGTLAYDGLINIMDGFILLILLLIYIILDTFTLKNKKEKNSKSKNKNFESNSTIKIILTFIIGLSGIIIGSNLLINNTIVLARFIGVPESVISLSLISLGTSLPELTTALTAIKKGHSSLSIGNIIGANILNLTLVIGGSALTTPLIVEKQNLILDIPVSFFMMLVVIVPCLLKNKITRIQGIILLTIYIVYISILYQIYIYI